MAGPEPMYLAKFCQQANTKAIDFCVSKLSCLCSLLNPKALAQNSEQLTLHLIRLDPRLSYPEHITLAHQSITVSSVKAMPTGLSTSLTECQLSKSCLYCKISTYQIYKEKCIYLFLIVLNCVCM